MGKKRNGFKEWGLNKHYLDFDTLNNSNLDNPNPIFKKYWILSIRFFENLILRLMKNRMYI